MQENFFETTLELALNSTCYIDTQGMQISYKKNSK